MRPPRRSRRRDILGYSAAAACPQPLRAARARKTARRASERKDIMLERRYKAAMCKMSERVSVTRMSTLRAADARNDITAPRFVA